jgi:hypothetical protein
MTSENQGKSCRRFDSAPSHSINEVRLERGRRGMVATVGQLCCAMGGHNFSEDSRVSAGGNDSGDRARVRAVDTLSEGLLQRVVGR